MWCNREQLAIFVLRRQTSLLPIAASGIFLLWLPVAFGVRQARPMASAGRSFTVPDGFVKYDVTNSKTDCSRARATLLRVCHMELVSEHHRLGVMRWLWRWLSASRRPVRQCWWSCREVPNNRRVAMDRSGAVHRLR